ncbi:MULTISPECIES: GNAT family N-acetyltransferase [Paenibacillus]|uniref:GNAT family N-acetyltransferase n=1 Tax=Paenibacillus TaxID=44249 RepID=UPI001E39AAD2|nr:GNAT family N-acetyltransferase [Paenibacillus sp. IHBB 10380]
MKQLPTIQLERLTLRPFTLEDAPTVQRLAGDPYIAETTLYIPHPYVDGMAEDWIKTHAVNYNEDRSLELAIVHTEEKNVIGATPPYDQSVIARFGLSIQCQEPYFLSGNQALYVTGI